MKITKKVLLFITLFAVIVGWVLSYPFQVLTNFEPLSWLHELIVMLGFFTIQTNILVGLCVYSLLCNKTTVWHSFWSSMPVMTGVTVYIVFMGLVQHFLLARGFVYDGLYMYTNLLHHYLTPLLMPVIWLLHRKPKHLKIIHTVSCLAFPLVYLCYWLVRGPIVGSYPYFFIDVNAFGYFVVVRNAFGFTILIILFALIFYGIDRLLPYKVKGS